MKKIIKKYYINILDTEILFCYCKSFSDVKKYITNKKILRNISKEVMGLNEGFDGIVIRDDITDEPFIIFLKSSKYSNNLLVHETNHLVHFYAKSFGFLNETEFQAYLQEQLFREFRHLILKK